MLSSIKIKLFFFIKIIFIYIILSLESYSDNLNKNNDFVILGSEEATVKIKIFSSLTCPHCAKFHIKLVPKIKEKYVDTGKVQLIFIDFPLDQLAFNASKTLHCLDKKKQIAFLDTIYETQSKWTSASNMNDVNKNLKEIAKNLGISSIQFDKCLVDEIISDKILNGRIEASKKYSISSTPTIVINEKKFEGSFNFESIEEKNRKAYLEHEI